MFKLFTLKSSNQNLNTITKVNCCLFYFIKITIYFETLNWSIYDNKHKHVILIFTLGFN